MITLALTVLALFPQEQAAPSSLAAAPADAFIIAYTPDLGAVRTATLESPWYRYFSEGPGTSYVGAVRDIFDDLEEEAPMGRSACDLLHSANGDALFFACDAGVGLVIGSGAGQEALDAKLDGLLEGAEVQWTVTASGHGGRRIESWASEQTDDFALLRGRGEGITAIFIGETEEQARGALGSALTRLGSDSATPAIERIRARLRGDAPRLVLDIDLKVAASLVQSEDPEAQQVIQALGLDRENYMLADVHRGGGALHQLLKWHFPQDSGLGRMADSLQPLEMRDLASLPSGTREFSLFRWSPSVFLDVALELAGSEGEELWNDAMLAGVSATGVRFDEDMIDLFSGSFASYRGVQQSGSVSLFDPLQGMSLQIGVTDGEAMEESFSMLLESLGMASAFELDSHGDYDVWSPMEMGEGLELPRVVFTEHAILVINPGEELSHALAPFSGDERPSLADDSAPVEALRSHAGAFYIGYQELAASVASLTQQFHSLGELAELELGEVPTWESLRKWFPEVSVSAAERTAAGIENRTTIR